MTWKPACIALTLAATLMVGGAGSASADSYWHEQHQDNWQERRSDQDHAREAVRQGKILPLGRVLANVQSAYPGRLLDAELVDGGNGPVYLIKMMTRDGIALVSADAVTGRVLGYRQGGH